jgi:hypothetical protein
MNNLKNNTAPVSLIGISGKMGHGKDTVAKIIQYLIATSRHNHNMTFYEYQDVFLDSDKWSEWKIKKFATPIKQIASIMTGISIEKMETQEDKEVMLSDEWNIVNWVVNLANPSSDEPSIKHVKKQSLRELLQSVGDVMLQIHPDWLLNVMFRDYTLTRYQYKDENEGYSTYPNWIISDLRKPNEYNKIKELGGKCIKIIKTPNLKGNDAFKQIYEAIPSEYTHISETALDSITNWDYVIEAEHGDISSLIKQVKEMLIKFKIL